MALLSQAGVRPSVIRAAGAKIPPNACSMSASTRTSGSVGMPVLRRPDARQWTATIACRFSIDLHGPRHCRKRGRLQLRAEACSALAELTAGALVSASATASIGVSIRDDELSGREARWDSRVRPRV